MCGAGDPSLVDSDIGEHECPNDFCTYPTFDTLGNPCKNYCDKDFQSKNVTSVRIFGKENYITNAYDPFQVGVEANSNIIDDEDNTHIEDDHNTHNENDDAEEQSIQVVIGTRNCCSNNKNIPEDWIPKEGREIDDNLPEGWMDGVQQEDNRRKKSLINSNITIHRDNRHLLAKETTNNFCDEPQIFFPKV